MDHPSYYRSGMFIRDRRRPLEDCKECSAVAATFNRVTQFKIDYDGLWLDVGNIAELPNMEDDEIITILEAIDAMSVEDRRTYLRTLERMEGTAT